MAHILREVGWDARTLPGGYRAYRRWVVEQLLALPEKFSFRVVHGPTGSGKSRLLAALERAGAQVVDLEALAAHRGSVLGALPSQPQPSQKWFESQLLSRLAALDPREPVYVEGESKKIGERQVPEALMARMRASPCVVLDTPLETRIALLLEEYEHFTVERGALEAQLECLSPLHGRERIGQWKALAAAGDWRAFVARLLVEHYDPAYGRSSARNFVRLAEAPRLRIGGTSDAAFDAAAREVLPVQSSEDADVLHRAAPERA
jgi:tRNA 2-selenouridine synthase